MKEEKIIEEPGDQFSNWANSLEGWERKFYFNKIALACDVSYQTVYCWSIKTRKVRKVYIDIINKTVGTKVIED